MNRTFCGPCRSNSSRCARVNIVELMGLMRSRQGVFPDCYIPRSGLHALCKFFWGAVSINFEKRCNHYRLILACMLSGVSRDRPVIVGWSTAPRGQVIEESLGQLPKKLAAGPRVLARTEIITHPIGHETGWTTARSLGEVGTTSVHSKPICLCSDCTFLDEIHRAAL